MCFEIIIFYCIFLIVIDYLGVVFFWIDIIYLMIFIGKIFVWLMKYWYF